MSGYRRNDATPRLSIIEMENIIAKGLREQEEFIDRVRAFLSLLPPSLRQNPDEARSPPEQPPLSQGPPTRDDLGHEFLQHLGELLTSAATGAKSPAPMPSSPQRKAQHPALEPNSGPFRDKSRASASLATTPSAPSDSEPAATATPPSAVFQEFRQLELSLLSLVHTHETKQEFLLNSVHTRSQSFLRLVEDAKKKYELSRGEYNQASARLRKEQQRVRDQPNLHTHIQRLVKVESEAHAAYEEYERDMLTLIDLLQGESRNTTVIKLLLQFFEAERRYYHRGQQIVSEFQPHAAGLALCRENLQALAASSPAVTALEGHERESKWKFLLELITERSGRLFEAIMEALSTHSSENKRREIYIALSSVFVVKRQVLPASLSQAIAREGESTKDAARQANEADKRLDVFLQSKRANVLFKFLLYNFEPLALSLRSQDGRQCLAFCALITCLSCWDIS